MDELRRLLDEQIAYYDARAGEYDLDMWQASPAPGIAGEVAELERALAEFLPAGDILELGCGTGGWTARLARWADQLTAVDASAEMIARARQKVPRVEYVEAGLFAWTPPRSFDVVSFSFVLSHVPPGRLTAFWDLVGRCLAPRGRIFLVDAAPGERANETTWDSEAVARRRLRDGRSFRVVKVFHEPRALEATLRARGWDARVRTTARTFLWATGCIPAGRVQK